MAVGLGDVSVGGREGGGEMSVFFVDPFGACEGPSSDVGFI